MQKVRRDIFCGSIFLMTDCYVVIRKKNFTWFGDAARCWRGKRRTGDRKFVSRMILRFFCFHSTRAHIKCNVTRVIQLWDDVDIYSRSIVNCHQLIVSHGQSKAKQASSQRDMEVFTSTQSFLFRFFVLISTSSLDYCEDNFPFTLIDSEF